jgi:hypothetical protein
MLRSNKRSLYLFAAPLALIAACSAAGGSVFTGSGGGSGNPGGTGAGLGTGPGQGGGGMINISIGSTGAGNGSGTGQASNCTVTDMNADMDGDGWTPAQGDCDDCDPNVNPGAIDVLHEVDGGTPYWGNEACDNGAGVKPCDSGLALNDTNAGDGARAIELCQFTTESPPLPMKTWGVISSQYVRADGVTPFAPGYQVGLQPGWGPNVHPQGGERLLAISSGHARTSSQPGSCGSDECDANAGGNPPPGFPLDNPNCPMTQGINDDVALKLKIRAPTNATGFSFNFKFYSFEYPEWVCDMYNDQFIALVTPPPQGSLNGDISFDSTHHPVSVNLAFFDVCDPNNEGEFAVNCQIDNFGGVCPSPPHPYCPLGTMELLGTGFDLWNPDGNFGGATRWLTSQAPIKGGEEFTIMFAMWDATDQAYDSTTLIDNFQWIANGSDVTVVTTPIPMPK